jgi:3-hydroxyacyl-CoA dehydrogenase/enoyl-CoA hydratase/3-hydroxybutyryl-CoA epimerase
MSAFTLKITDDVAIMSIDVVGETVNTLRAEFAEQIILVLDEITATPDLTAIVIISAKVDNFIAGADISMLDNCKTEQEVKDISQMGQRLFDQLAALDIPVIAAINGACLGGGLELALACHGRICTDNAKTTLGLPEVQLGLLPGSGGTQRLPRLVGIAKALDLMLTAKQLRPRQALKIGLVDDVVPEAILLECAIELAKKGKQYLNDKTASKPNLDWQGKLLETTTIARRLLFSQALKTVVQKTKGHYPAPLDIIECVRVGIEHGMQAGLELEATKFSKLVFSAQSIALRSLFFATTELKKSNLERGVSPKTIEQAVVLGGGLMGGGIANVCATKAQISVRIKDISQQGISQAFKYSYDLLNKKRRRRYISDAQLQSTMLNLSGTTNYSGFKNVDIVIEAVFEDLALKHQMLKDIEQHCAPDTIFASNTSSLAISEIARVAQRPQNVVGLHYFSPVDKMPLVEVIAHDKTSQQTIATTVAFARQQGKTPIVVKDGAGFYVNRILAIYINEAAYQLLEGIPVDDIDQALVNFGFPLGPLMLLDEVGIDVSAKISPILLQAHGDRFKGPQEFSKLVTDNRKGKKNSRGFYLYGAKTRFKMGNSKSKSKQVDPSIYPLLNIKPTSKRSSDLIAQRCMVQMLNEAVRCLDEGIISCPRDGDIGAIFGIGFPPFLAGPFRYIDAMGPQRLVSLLEQYTQEHGERFTPSPLLKTMAQQQQFFYPPEQ